LVAGSVQAVSHETRLARIVVSVLAALTVATLFYELVLPAGEVPYRMVDEITAADEGRELKAHGWILAGSIRSHDGWYSFVLHKRGVTRLVIGNGALPDGVKDQWEIVVTGHLRGGVLQASRLASKCSSNYQGSRFVDPKFE
jgi:cytochrome c-type biogenesis protein CcmE